MLQIGKIMDQDCAGRLTIALFDIENINNKAIRI